MASTMCHDFKSCLERSQTEPVFLRLKLTPSNSEECLTTANLSLSDTNMGRPGEGVRIRPKEMSKWSFLGNFSHPCQEKVSSKFEGKTGQVYVHPLAKRLASSVLGSQSLDMCTESLGSETGSHVCSENNESSSLMVLDPSISSPPRESRVHSRRKITLSLPPPLTTLSGGSSCIRVRSHREDGRLVMRAVSMPSSSSLFQVERSHVRVTMRLQKHEFEENGDGDEVIENEIELEEGSGHKDDEIEDSVFLDIGENAGRVEDVTTGIIKENCSKISSNARCYEENMDVRDNRGMWNGEACWVAT